MRGLGTNSQWPLNKAITPRATVTYQSKQPWVRVLLACFPLNLIRKPNHTNR